MHPHCRWTRLSLVLMFGVTLAPVDAHADAIGEGESCPPGARPVVGHIGTYCERADCTGEGPCEAAGERPGRCRPMRICTQSFEVYVRTSQLDGDYVSTPIVVETCEADAACDGSGDRAPTVGEPTNDAITCVERRVCAAVPFPPLTSRDRTLTVDDPEEPTPRGPRDTVPANTTQPGACGCRAAPSRSRWVGWLVFALVCAPRRRR